MPFWPFNIARKRREREAKKTGFSFQDRSVAKIDEENDARRRRSDDGFYTTPVVFDSTPSRSYFPDRDATPSHHHDSDRSSSYDSGGSSYDSGGGGSDGGGGGGD